MLRLAKILLGGDTMVIPACMQTNIVMPVASGGNDAEVW
jgi:hypothetical protein